jgi:hypothetical protein
MAREVTSSLADYLSFSSEEYVLMSNAKIKALANLMRDRRESGDPPYVLILGDGASLRSTELMDAVLGTEHDLDGLHSFSDAEKLREFYEILDRRSENERYVMLSRHLRNKKPSKAHRYLAALIIEGYFDVVFTTCFDHALEDALSANMPVDAFTVLVNGRDKEEQIVKILGYGRPRVKVVKLHGDLNSRIFAFTPEEVFEFTDQIERVLKMYLNHDVIIVGHGMRDDDINRCIKARGGALWYVNPTPPSMQDYVGRAMRVRGQEGNVISGRDGNFHEFFKLLRQELRVRPREISEQTIKNFNRKFEALFDLERSFVLEREITKSISQILGPGRGSVAVSGNLGTGKTTLLKRILADTPIWRAESGPELTMAYVDCLEETMSSIVDFYRVSFSSQVCGTEVYDHFDVESVLERLYQDNKHLVLCLDNFDWVVRALLEDSETMTRDFFSHLRGLINRRPRALSLVVVTCESLRELCQTIDFGGASPFPSSFMSVRLRELSESRARQLIAGAAGELFNEPEFEFILKLVEQRYPFDLLVACTYLAEAKRRGDKVNYDDVSAAYMDILG